MRVANLNIFYPILNDLKMVVSHYKYYSRVSHLCEDSKHRNVLVGVV